MRNWVPEFDITERRVAYLPSIQCGFCDQPTVQMIACVGLCEKHLAIVREIETTGTQRAPRCERRRKAPPRTTTATCACGEVFTYTPGQAGALRWCPDCRKLHTTHSRRQHVKRLERERKEATQGI